MPDQYESRSASVRIVAATHYNRELENVIGHSCTMCASDMADVQDLPAYLVSRNTSEAAASANSGEPSASSNMNARWCVMLSLVVAETRAKPPVCFTLAVMHSVTS